jgi:predicted esterase
MRKEKCNQECGFTRGHVGFVAVTQMAPSSVYTRNVRARFVLVVTLWLSPALLAQQHAEAPRPGQIELRQICAAHTDQTYALYLPSSYTPQKKWPIVYAFDPAARGNRPMEAMKDAAERYGYIVAASNNSRNGAWQPEIEAAQAVSDDTHTRFSIDDRQVYFTGFSGGARVASRIGQICKCAAGVFLNGAGFPIGSHPTRDAVFPVFSAVGNVDFNLPEVTRLDESLEAAGFQHFLRYFDGPHQWAPATVAEEAFAWFRLLAMKTGVVPRDADFIAQQRDAALARGKAIEQAGDLYIAWRDYNASAATFEQLTDATPLRQAADALASQKTVKDGAKRQKQEFDEQADLTADISAAFAGFHRSSNLTDSIDSTKKQIVRLREAAAREKRPEKALVYRRAVAQVFVYAMEAGIERLEGKETTLAKDYFLLAAEANPDEAGPFANIAVAMVMDNNRKGAFDALRQAKQRSPDHVAFAAWLQSEPTFQKFHDDPDFRVLLSN